MSLYKKDILGPGNEQAWQTSFLTELLWHKRLHYEVSLYSGFAEERYLVDQSGGISVGVEVNCR